MIETYDVVIIGSGISGLITGNYLAKSGFKTLIVEQHHVAGGCCSYFTRNGYTFDCGAHSLGSLRPGGQLRQIFDDFDLYDGSRLKRAEISDTIITDKRRVDLGSNCGNVINEFSKSFPKNRKEIQLLFETIDGFDINDRNIYLRYYSRFKDVTFENFVSSYVSNEDLKSMIYILLGNCGLPAHALWALAGISMIKEFIFDGGYYFEEGMKYFIASLVEKFVEYGGDIRFRSNVEKILSKNNIIHGIELKNSEAIQTKVVVSTASQKATYTKLLDRSCLSPNTENALSKQSPSMSAVVVHLGINSALLNQMKWGRTIWYCPKNNANAIYNNVYEGGVDEYAQVMLLSIPVHHSQEMAPRNKSTLYCFIAASCKDRIYWKRNKDLIANRIMGRVEELMPNIASKVEVKEVATPYTIERYTLNDQGAMYGLASTLFQSKPSIDLQYPRIKGLYLSGHWNPAGAGGGYSYGGIFRKANS